MGGLFHASTNMIHLLCLSSLKSPLGVRLPSRSENVKKRNLERRKS